MTDGREDDRPEDHDSRFIAISQLSAKQLAKMLRPP